MGRHTIGLLLRGVILPLCLLAGMFGGQLLVLCHGSDGHQSIELNHAGGACVEATPCHSAEEAPCLASHQPSCDDQPLVGTLTVERNRPQRLAGMALVAVLFAQLEPIDSNESGFAVHSLIRQHPPELLSLRTITLLI